MTRHIVRATGALLIGMAASIIVAWLCVRPIATLPRDVSSADEEIHTAGQGAFGYQIHFAFRLSQRLRDEGYFADQPPPPSWVRRPETVHDPSFTVGAGWPLICLRGVRSTTKAIPHPPNQFIELGSGDDRRSLPLRPIPLALAANTVAYSVPAYALLLVPISLRRLIRARRGLCPRCGYDLADSPGACPECGRESRARRGRVVA